jgi:hypothetical protein
LDAGLDLLQKGGGKRTGKKRGRAMCFQPIMMEIFASNDYVLVIDFLIVDLTTMGVFELYCEFHLYFVWCDW